MLRRILVVGVFFQSFAIAAIVLTLILTVTKNVHWLTVVCAHLVAVAVFGMLICLLWLIPSVLRIWRAFLPYVVGFSIAYVLFAIGIYGVVYDFVGIRASDGTTSHSLRDGLYLSAITWATVGYGDFTLNPDFRLLSAAEALTGLFTVPLATSLIWFSCEQAIGDESTTLAMKIRNELDASLDRRKPFTSPQNLEIFLETLIRNFRSELHPVAKPRHVRTAEEKKLRSTMFQKFRDGIGLPTFRTLIQNYKARKQIKKIADDVFESLWQLDMACSKFPQKPGEFETLVQLCRANKVDIRKIAGLIENCTEENAALSDFIESVRKGVEMRSTIDTSPPPEDRSAGEPLENVAPSVPPGPPAESEIQQAGTGQQVEDRETPGSTPETQIENRDTVEQPDDPPLTETAPPTTPK